MENFNKVLDNIKYSVNYTKRKTIEKIKESFEKIKAEPGKAKHSSEIFASISKAIIEQVLNGKANMQIIREDIANKLADVLGKSAENKGKKFTLNINWDGANLKNPTGVEALTQYIKDCVNLCSSAIEKNNSEPLPIDKSIKLATAIVEKFKYYTVRNKGSVLFNLYEEYWSAFYKLFENKKEILSKLLNPVNEQLKETNKDSSNKEEIRND